MFESTDAAWSLPPRLRGLDCSQRTSPPADRAGRGDLASDRRCAERTLNTPRNEFLAYLRSSLRDLPEALVHLPALRARRNPCPVPQAQLTAARRLNAGILFRG